MNEQDLKKLWQATTNKEDMAFNIKQENTAAITLMKIQNFVSSMKPLKIFTLLAGILWLGIGSFVLLSLYKNAFGEISKFFFFSAFIQLLITAVALLFYIHQLFKIYQVDMVEDVLNTQVKLAQLRISTLWSTRILFLQLPLWTTFWWNDVMFAEWNILQWAFVLIITVIFTIAAIWLFFNIKYENRNKPWFKIIFTGKEWQPIINSMEMLDQVEEYKK